MPGHAGDCRIQALDIRHASDGAEQAGDDVEAAAEVETGHVAEMKADIRQTSPGKREQVLIKIDAFDLEPGSELGKMLAGAAGHIQERARRPLDRLFDHQAHFGCFSLVILGRVDSIVIGCGFREHWRFGDPRSSGLRTKAVRLFPQRAARVIGVTCAPFLEELGQRVVEPFRQHNPQLHELIAEIAALRVLHAFAAQAQQLSAGCALRNQ